MIWSRTKKIGQRKTSEAGPDMGARRKKTDRLTQKKMDGGREGGS